MEKYRNRIAFFILSIIFMLFGLVFTSCSNDNPSNNSEKETFQSDNNKEYQQFDLSTDNFEHFFDFKYYSAGNMSNRADIYEVIGVLNYAYYDNVVVTFNIVYTENKKDYKGEYTVTLNAAGYASFRTDDSKLLNAIGCTFYDWDTEEQITVKSVTGKVVLFN